MLLIIVSQSIRKLMRLSILNSFSPKKLNTGKTVEYPRLTIQFFLKSHIAQAIDI